METLGGSRVPGLWGMPCRLLLSGMVDPWKAQLYSQGALHLSCTPSPSLYWGLVTLPHSLGVLVIPCFLFSQLLVKADLWSFEPGEVSFVLRSRVYSTTWHLLNPC